MSSAEPASNNPAGLSPTGRDRATGRTLLWAAAALAALAIFAFWLNSPQPHFVPAPLDPVGPDCPKTSRVFVPTNATEVPELPSSGVSQREKDRMIFRAN